MSDKKSEKMSTLNFADFAVVRGRGRAGSSGSGGRYNFATRRFTVPAHLADGTRAVTFSVAGSVVVVAPCEPTASGAVRVHASEHFAVVPAGSVLAETLADSAGSAPSRVLAPCEVPVGAPDGSCAYSLD